MKENFKCNNRLFQILSKFTYKNVNKDQNFSNLHNLGFIWKSKVMSTY